MLKFTLTTLIVSCLAMPQLSAQGKQRSQAGDIDLSRLPSLPPAQEGDRICQVLSTFLTNKNDIFYYKIGSTYYRVALAGEALSVRFPVRGAATFKLYTMSLNEDDEEVYTPVVEQALGGQPGGKFLIVLSRSEDNAPFKAKTHNLSKSNLPANTVYMFNECPVALGVQVDESKSLVKSQQTFTYKYNIAGRDAYTSAKIVMHYKGEDKTMSSKRLRLVPGRRIMLFCFPSKTRIKLGSTPLKLVTIQDQP